MIPLDIAKRLMAGQVLFCLKFRDAQGKPAPCVVNGTVKTWRRNPSRVRVPIKHELDSSDYLTEKDLHLLFLSREEAMGQRGKN